VWLVETAPDRGAQVATLLEDRLSDFGVDLIDTRQRLAAYHEVENTYLSTFQALGGLGLLIGTIGLAAVLARNVLERRRELGLLGAVGFESRHLSTLVLAESGVLVLGGLCLGTGAALLAVWPALVERAQALPFASLGVILGVVALTGLTASIAAVRLVAAMSMTEAVKAE
jgi:putative ABC transport system permease protein